MDNKNTIILKEKAMTPDGVEIILEDWSALNTAKFPELYGLHIIAYPIAKNSSRYGWVTAGKPFALHISMSQYHHYTNDDVMKDFESLKSGEKTLIDLSERYWNGEEDKYYLGLINGDGMLC